jgi:hypothetical protein
LGWRRSTTKDRIGDYKKAAPCQRIKGKNNSRNAAVYDTEAVQKFLDYDARRALTEFASARWPGVDSQVQGMTIRLLLGTFAVARAMSLRCA